MAEQHSKGLGGLGRLFARAQERRRERRQREEEQRRARSGDLGRTGDERAYRALQERRALEMEQRRFAERERGGYGPPPGRGPWTERYPGGREAWGPRRPWEAGGTWEGGGTMRVRRAPYPAGGETWRGGEYRGGREHWRGAEFRGGGAETWRNRDRRRAMEAREPRGRMPGAPPGGWPAHPSDHPRGLGEAYDEDVIPPMERGWHPERPGAGMVEPLGAGSGGYGGPHGGYAAREWRGYAAPPPSWGDREEQELGARRVGPGAFVRPSSWVGEHHGSWWEGGSEAARTGVWFGGERDRSRWAGSGPGTERTGEWIGGDAGRERPASAWYGGGVHEARDERAAQSFGSLGGPHQGRYGREPAPDRGGGRGFGGPLGRFQDRWRGEQGRLYDGRYRGREDDYPIYGEAVAGRGHVGSEDYRDLARFGLGGADRGSARRFREAHESDHFRSR